MGADRAVLVSDDAAAGSDLVATSRLLAAALEKENADLVLFGQQASDADGAVLWAAVAERLGRPVVSQAMELAVDGGSVRVKRQTEFGYDTIEAPLPAVVAVSDAINEPRYPSLKGIMGAKKKPQDVLSLAELGVDAGEAGEAGSRTTGARARRPARARRRAQDRRRRQRRAGDRRLPRREEARLMATLVFLEHHGDELQKGSLGVLAKAASLGDGDVAAVLAGEGAKALAARGREVRRGEGLGLRGRRGRAAAAAAARRRARAGRRGRRLRHRPLRELGPRRRRRRRPRGAPRRRASTGISSTSSCRDGELVGKRPALQDSVYADVGWTSTPRLALFRAGSFDATPTGGGEPEIVDVSPSYARAFARRVKLVGQDAEESSGPSIEDADVIVAGGRGLGSPDNFTLAEELAKALGGAVGATRAVVDAGWYPYSAQIGQTGKTVSPKLYVALGISGAIQHKVGMQSSGTIVAINKDANAPIFEFSDLGVVGDVHEIVPKLTELVRAAARRDGDAPSNFPPPFSARDYVAEPTDPAGRADRGRRPRSSARGRRAWPARSASASCSKSTRRWPSGSARCRSRSLEKGKQPGSHLLSGAVVNPRALRRLFGDRFRMRGPAVVRPGARRVGLRPHAPRRAPDPAAAADAQPRQLDLLALASSAASSPSRRRRAAR